MPLPKDMSKCMSKVKDEYPHGRSDKKKSKKQAHKQHVAMCLNVKEGLTFKQFLESVKSTYDIGDPVVTPFGKGKIVAHEDKGLRTEHFMVTVDEAGRKKFNLEDKPYKMSSFDFHK